METALFVVATVVGSVSIVGGLAMAVLEGRQLRNSRRFAR